MYKGTMKIHKSRSNVLSTKKTDIHAYVAHIYYGTDYI